MKVYLNIQRDELNLYYIDLSSFTEFMLKLIYYKYI